MVWTLNAIKVTAFALERPALRQRKVFPMHRFALLADGNPMLLSSTLGILPCQPSNFLYYQFGSDTGCQTPLFTTLLKLLATLQPRSRYFRLRRSGSVSIHVCLHCSFTLYMSVVMVSLGLHHLIQGMGNPFRLLAGFISPIGDNGQTWAAFSPIMCFYSHLFHV